MRIHDWQDVAAIICGLWVMGSVAWLGFSLWRGNRRLNRTRQQFRADVVDLDRIRSLRNTEVDQYIRDGRGQR